MGVSYYAHLRLGISVSRRDFLITKGTETRCHNGHKPPADRTPKFCEQCGITTIPQADPNGLFSPASAEGTWVMCKHAKSGDVRPVYVEPRIVVSPFPLRAEGMPQAESSK